MHNTEKLEKITKLIKELMALEKQEEIIMSLGGKASNGECKSFNVNISCNSFEKKEKQSVEEEIDFYTKSLRAHMDRTIFGANTIINSPFLVESINKTIDFKLEVGDADLLEFLGMAITIIAARKKRIVNSLKRLGVKI